MKDNNHNHNHNNINTNHLLSEETSSPSMGGGKCLTNASNMYGVSMKSCSKRSQQEMITVGMERCLLHKLTKSLPNTA